MYSCISICFYRSVLGLARHQKAAGNATRQKIEKANSLSLNAQCREFDAELHVFSRSLEKTHPHRKKHTSSLIVRRAGESMPSSIISPALVAYTYIDPSGLLPGDKVLLLPGRAGVEVWECDASEGKDKRICLWQWGDVLDIAGNSSSSDPEDMDFVRVTILGESSIKQTFVFECDDFGIVVSALQRAQYVTPSDGTSRSAGAYDEKLAHLGSPPWRNRDLPQSQVGGSGGRLLLPRLFGFDAIRQTQPRPFSHELILCGVR